MKLVGMLLIVGGVLALLFGGFSYTKREKVLEIGPLEATKEEHKTVPISPIVGLAAIAGGIVLVISNSRTRV